MIELFSLLGSQCVKPGVILSSHVVRKVDSCIVYSDNWFVTGTQQKQKLYLQVVSGPSWLIVKVSQLPDWPQWALSGVTPGWLIRSFRISDGESPWCYRNVTSNVLNIRYNTCEDICQNMRSTCSQPPSTGLDSVHCEMTKDYKLKVRGERTGHSQGVVWYPAWWLIIMVYIISDIGNWR